MVPASCLLPSNLERWMKLKASRGNQQSTKCQEIHLPTGRSWEQIRYIRNATGQLQSVCVSEEGKGEITSILELSLVFKHLRWKSTSRAHAWLAMVISCGNQGPRPCTFGPCQWGCEVHGERIRFLKKLPSKVIYSSDPQIESYTLCFASIDCGKILFSLNFVSEGSRK